MLNESGKWLLLTADGRIVEGEAHPEGRMILAAPGVHVTDDWLRKVPALKDALRAKAPEPEAKMVKGPAETKQVTMPPESKAEPAAPGPKGKGGGK